MLMDDARPGRSSTSTTDENVEEAKKIVTENRRIVIGETAVEVGYISSRHVIFSNVLSMKRVATKFVPK